MGRGFASGGGKERSLENKGQEILKNEIENLNIPQFYPLGQLFF